MQGLRQYLPAVVLWPFTRPTNISPTTSTTLVVEFVAWPVTLGDEVVRKWAKVRTRVGMLQILTPTQCIKDRLAAFFHWRDSQSLEQALLVAKAHRVSMKELARWSSAEGHAEGFEEFRRRLQLIRREGRSVSTRVPKYR